MTHELNDKFHTGQQRQNSLKKKKWEPWNKGPRFILNDVILSIMHLYVIVG